MLKRVKIKYSVTFEAEAVMQKYDPDTDQDLIDHALAGVDIPEGGDSNSIYVIDSIELVGGSVENA